MSMLLLPVGVVPFRMNDRGRRRMLVLGGRRCRAMVAEGGMVDRMILVIGGIYLLHLRGHDWM